MTSPKQILFLVSEFTYVRNYLRTGALDSVLANHNVRFALAEEVSEGDHPLADPQIVGTFKYTPKQVRLQAEIFQILAWRHRKKSRTFFYRWLRQSNWNLVVRQLSLLARFRALLAWSAGILTQRSLFIGPILGNRFLFKLSFSVLTRRRQPNEGLSAIIEQGNWDLIAIPSAGFEPATFDAIRVAKSKKIPTLALIDNWDNLVSKTVFSPKPDQIGVWGEQAEKQAIEVQGFEKQAISLIGTPRFDQYFIARDSFTAVRGDYILFVGSAMPFDELGALHSIENALEELGLETVPIVYRPHPWQQKRLVNSVFNESDFRVTVLDTQIAAAKRQLVQQSSTDTRFQPDLSHYPDLFRNSRIVIGPLTTMLLEASICVRPVIGLSYDDGYHFTTSLKYFSHFDGMESVPGFQFCDTKDRLRHCLQKGLGQPAINPELLDAGLSQFLVIEQRPYPERLLELVNHSLRN